MEKLRTVVGSWDNNKKYLLITTETYASATTGGVLNVSAIKELEANSKLGGIINVHEQTDKITETISVGGVVNYLYDQ